MLSFRELISLDELASLDTFRDLQEVKFPFPLGVVGGVGVIVAGVAVNVPSSIGKAWPASSRTFAKFSVRLMERNLSQGQLQNQFDDGVSRKPQNIYSLNHQWYFVTKIVLAQCQKKLFYLFEQSGSEQCLVTECFFNLLLEVSYVS